MTMKCCRRGWLFGCAEMFCLTSEQNASAEGGETFLQSNKIVHLDVLQRHHLPRHYSAVTSVTSTKTREMV